LKVPIITISRGSYSKGKEIAEKVAARLDYHCLAREVVLKEASEQHQIPEVTLARAVHDAPTILERLGYKKEKYVACYQAVLLKHFQKDNVVYHGLAGQFFVGGVPHVVKVRILADMEDRVRWEMEREQISEKEARRILEKDDDERRKWSKSLYGIDTWDAQSYDIVLHINKITVDDAVGIICHTASLPSFQATDESRKKMDDLIVASSVRTALIDFKPDIEVSCNDGVVLVRTTVSLTKEDAVVDEIKRIANAIPDVREVQVSAHSALVDV
jgi:cytidylate kinase